VLWVQFVLLRAEREIGRQMLAVFFFFLSRTSFDWLSVSAYSRTH
jgi:hypothetical protein